jgi:elongation factor P
MAQLSSLNDIKVGIIIVHNDEPWQVSDTTFTKKSRGAPTMTTKMKNLVTGKTLEVTFKPVDKIEEATITRKKAQFLYADNDSANMMDNESYEQVALPLEVVGDKVTYLKEGENIDILYFNDNPITISIPVKVELKVTSAPPGVKGDSAQGRVQKSIELENGVSIQAPLFIKEGDSIRINTDTGEYVERVSE